MTGWSAPAVRRHTRWLYSVDAPALDGEGWAVTLTLRDCPPDATAWQNLRRAWDARLRRMGALRVHWVVEWQRRGVPHLHAAVYFPAGSPRTLGPRVVTAWLDVAEAYRPSVRSQTCKPIDGTVGWLQYLSKHAARGVKHYQRAGKPQGWQTTGRLWGHTGAWPALAPIELTMSSKDFYRFRRLVRAWRIADARAAGLRGEGWSRLRYARRMLRSSDPDFSRYRGVSEWVPERIALALFGVTVAP